MDRLKEYCGKISGSVLGILLIGYVLGDRGFAHIGWPPVYVSEISLAICLSLYIVTANIAVFTKNPVIPLLLPFIVWCLFQTVGYVGEYGVDALRDAAIYGYAVFCIIVASAVDTPEKIRDVCIAYRKAMTVCVLLLPLMLLLQRLHGDDGSDEEIWIIGLKWGDTIVHVVGIMSFHLLGLGSFLRPTRGLADRAIKTLFWIILIALLFWGLSAGRGPIVATFSGLAVLGVLSPNRKRLTSIVLGFLAVIALIGLLGLGIKQDDERDLSANQIVANALSIVGVATDADAVDSDLANTALWRLNWWSDIVDYVVFGPYFWSGKGFGINIAVDDGYGRNSDATLRSPHNCHMTILARAGVPGLVLWLIFLASFLVIQVRMARRMPRLGFPVWGRLNIWVLSYWVAAIVNGTFDVYLEGPQGGIWFWSITGFGVALVMQERRLLARTTNTAETPMPEAGVPAS